MGPPRAGPCGPSPPCAPRLRRLQRLCADLDLDALLFVAGPDGRYNLGSAQALAYLFQGRCDTDPRDTPPLAPHLRDLVLMVTPEDVRLCCDGRSMAQAWALLGPLRETARTFRAEGPSEDGEDGDDGRDAGEGERIWAFLQMLAGVRRVGLPLGVGAAGARMEAERWPLVQACGLDGVGKDGFFTMNYEVPRRSDDKTKRKGPAGCSVFSSLRLFVALSVRCFAIFYVILPSSKD
ncbi:unnamed protein product [Ostreobium quekettii]|uniref:DAAF9 N-terminal domain-containing protein n=1 Tax=Ostreobium quekettii TaxID=121088 RepID=A0A8S1IWA8_9CHLO|nr:unnamed protein product [Ostreobium quekettii]